MKKLTLVLLLLAGNALAQSLPAWYPSEGFRQHAVIDYVYLEERRIVIGDSNYRLAESFTVRSMSSSNDSVARIRPGVRVGFKMNSAREITEFFLLPANYRDRRSR